MRARVPVTRIRSLGDPDGDPDDLEFDLDFAKLHPGGWDEAQDHWEQVVVMFLNCDQVNDRKASESMAFAEDAAKRVLWPLAVDERCPKCRRVGG